jgi:hypothetical protein
MIRNQMGEAQQVRNGRGVRVAHPVRIKDNYNISNYGTVNALNFCVVRLLHICLQANKTQEMRTCIRAPNRV